MSNEEKQTDDFSKQAEFATSDIDGSIITEFYRGRSIFITGGTGFMGKVSLLLLNSAKVIPKPVENIMLNYV